MTDTRVAVGDAVFSGVDVGSNVGIGECPVAGPVAWPVSSEGDTAEAPLTPGVSLPIGVALDWAQPPNNRTPTIINKRQSRGFSI